MVNKLFWPQFGRPAWSYKALPQPAHFLATFLGKAFWQIFLNHVLDHLSKAVSKTKFKIPATLQKIFWNLFLNCPIKVVEKPVLKLTAHSKCRVHQKSSRKLMAKSWNSIFNPRGCRGQILRCWDIQILRFSDSEILRYWDSEILRYWMSQILRFSDTEILRS